jgi:hypothetical protein
MKKYNNNFTVYGQCTAGRIVYWQKMGVAKGIMENIYWLMYDQKKKYYEEHGITPRNH